MSCDRCGGELFQVQAGKTPVPVGGLPQICRQCGRVTLDGKPVPLPADFDAKLASLADEAARAGKEVGEAVAAEVSSTGTLRVENYFAQVYRTAFLRGFFAAIHFWKTTAKEGRLRRLRALWGKAEAIDPTGRELAHFLAGRHVDPGAVTIRLSGAVFKELHQLLTLGFNEDGNADGQDPSNQRATGHSGQAPVS